MRKWKYKIEGRGGIKQLLRIWRYDLTEKIEFQDLLQRIDEEFHPQNFSRRTKIYYLNKLVDKKLLGKKRKGRKTYYWPLKPQEVIRVCLLDLLSLTPKEYLVSSGFLTFFGFNLEELSREEKVRLTQLKNETKAVFDNLARLWQKHFLDKIEREWKKIIEDEEIHPINKWVTWHSYATHIYYPKKTYKQFLNQIFPTIWKVCDKHGMKLEQKEKKRIKKQIAKILEGDPREFEEITEKLNRCFPSGKIPLIMVGAIPFEGTPLGDKVFDLEYALERDLLKTVESEIDRATKRKFQKQFQGKSRTELAELKRALSREKKAQILALGREGTRQAELEKQLCDWIRSNNIETKTEPASS